jgi:integrase
VTVAGARHPAPVTFETKLDASSWLAAQARLVEAGAWTPPTRIDATATVRDYAERFLAERDLRPRTRAHYRWLFESYIEPRLGGVRIGELTPALVRSWHARTAPERPTTRAQAYGLLRTILGTAVVDGIIASNPCVIRGAGNAKRATTTKPATPAEIAVMAETIAPRYRAGLLLAAWCGLRFGELAELRRGDVDIEAGTVTIARAVTRVDGETIIGPPKSDAGRRTVVMPAHVTAAVAEHLERFVGASESALVLPAAGDATAHLAPASLYRVFYRAREAAGRPDLRWHDLRHSALTLAAQTGATLADLMARAGHSTAGAAMRYQHAAQDRDALVAAGLDAIAGAGNVVPLASRRRPA